MSLLPHLNVIINDIYIVLFDILVVHNESSYLLPNLYYETYAFKLS